MNLKALKNEALIEELKTHITEERVLTNKILYYLLEVESRMLFAEMGYSSMYDFCIKFLLYSEGSAHLRISAMRFLKTLPKAEQQQTEEKLASGDLTLSHLSSLQKFVKLEEKENGEHLSLPDKMDLLSQVENKSKRETEKILADKNPTMIPKEKERVITQNQTQITFMADNRLMKKLNRVRDLRAAISPEKNYAELFEALCDLYLSKKDPLKNENKNKKAVTKKAEGTKKANAQKAANGKRTIQVNEPGKVSETDKIKGTADLKNSENKTPTFPERSSTAAKANFKIIPKSERKSRFIPKSIKDAVWQRDEGRCTFKSLKTDRFCHSTFGLELDHLHPHAMGGENTVANLRLRCKMHNRLHAINTLFTSTNESDILTA